MILIINADDFGLDERTNKGIVRSFQRGLCSSTTLMPNMPDFEEACQLSHENKLLKHVGIHLVLRDGCPLTEKIKYFPKFCNSQGQLCFSPNRFFIGLENSEKRALAEEIRAQIRRCRKYGLPLTHLDTHHSLHYIWAVCSVLIPIAHQEDIPYIRIKGNSDLSLVPFRFKIYTQIFNYRLKFRGLAKTRYFGSIHHFLALKKRLDSLDAIDSFEISLHPRLNDKQALVDKIFDKEIDLEAELRQIDAYKDILSFSGTKYL